MTSVRVRLLIGTGLAMAVVLIGSFVVLSGLVRGAIRSGLDRSLETRVRSFAALLEVEGDAIDVEFAEVTLPEFEPSPRAQFFQVWRTDGPAVARSRSMGGADLPKLIGPEGEPVLRDLTLPDGRPGRAIGFTLIPRRDSEDPSTATPPTVTLVLARGVEDVESTVRVVNLVLMGVALATLGLSTIALGWAVRRGFAPVEDLSRQIAELDDGGLDARLESAGAPSELAPMVDRLNDLLHRLDAAFTRERRFTGDVAHQLRTPLSGMRSTLEVALSRPRDEAGYRRSLTQLLQITLDMQHMVERLLELARADAGRFDIHREEVDVVATLEGIWAEREDLARARGMTIEWRVIRPMAVATDADALRVALHNVIDNAVAHGRVGGTVVVSVAAARDGHFRVSVRSDGCSLDPEGVDRVFDRFWQGEVREHHCGLGLAVTRRVVEQLGGTVTAEVVDGWFEITLSLPAD
jgi:two-component system heavy metal sensor histidine kinase CusS